VRYNIAIGNAVFSCGNGRYAALSTIAAASRDSPLPDAVPASEGANQSMRVGNCSSASWLALQDARAPCAWPRPHQRAGFAACSSMVGQLDGGAPVTPGFPGHRFACLRHGVVRMQAFPMLETDVEVRNGVVVI